LIETERLARRFGYRTALADFTTSVERGHIRLVVGPNGAGKTTLIKILATLTRPSAGRARISGIDIQEDPEAVRALIGVVLHEPLLYPELTAMENLRFYGSLYGVEGEERLRNALVFVGLLPRAADQVGTFSMGMQKRLAIARATLHRPEVLLLDEPLAGLDREGIRAVTRFLKEWRDGGKTVVMTTHSLERDWELGDSVTALDRGRAILERDATPDSLDDFLSELEARVGGN
jgi:heme exporter protein A